MKRFCTRARTFLQVYYGVMTEYRAEMFLWAIATSLPLIMMGVWMQAGASGRFPMTEADLARYFVAVFIVRQLSIAWVIYDFEYHVVTGRLSPLLLQPIDPVWRFVVPHLSEQLARLPFVVVLVAFVLWLYPAALQSPDGSDQLWWPAWWQVAAAGCMTYCAFCLRFLMQYTLAMLAFWVERVVAFDRLLMIPYLFLSGLIAPLEVFPDSVRRIAELTPFPYLVWFPARLLSGNPVPLTQGVIVIVGWTLALYALSRYVWARGLRHYSAMGA